ncbi:TetR/AcrR family transcriptional regulator [Stackebrandtia nassauensis]|uniref:Transcriptional regulator, TetR family n=1 Tax=Stackebrandtia nassauensis (strain DSM 44728 / CIP 108903 / NRRL B-16338 / NBRC 102104 / LLR-40K-21) TaxID=446470 RepID=D3Q8C9_STANL|nr:TetR/AcrR family transcriptional regulator [Stackebrandtia nassauensis]ADD42503.1 transcriptional regulator, TetR family [Stackebrandtia nassauensis DSM 44728]
MTRAAASARPPGRPRNSVDATVFAATLSTVDELGYARATVDRIAAAAGIAKTTIYRRWPTKGALITACLIEAFGPLPMTATTREDFLAESIRFAAAKIAEPGVGAAFAGVFTDAVNDPALREILATQLQEPYLIAIREVLGEPEHRVLFLIDVIIGTLLHRMGMTGEPMVDDDVDALVAMTLRVLD